MTKTVEEFVNAGCELSAPLNVFIALHQETRGNPCPGCFYDSHGNRCDAKKDLYSSLPPHPNREPDYFGDRTAGSTKKPVGETVREEAQRLGLSINEVRRRRRAEGRQTHG